MSKYQTLIDALNGDNSLFSNVRNGDVRALLADLERAEKALAALAQQSQEPVGDRYFSYSTDLGFEEYPTRDEAIECANIQIKHYREDAIRDDEWPDEVDSVCWGVILGRSKEIDTSDEDHESVDYKLYTTPPAPQPAPVDELIEALEDLMDWQVKNVALWHNRAYDRAHRAIKKHRAALQSPAPQTGRWLPIASAPRGSGENGPRSVNDPAYVKPPDLLLIHPEGISVGYYDWYYHPGYGVGASQYEPVWRSRSDGAGLDGVTHWMPLPAAPQTEGQP